MIKDVNAKPVARETLSREEAAGSMTDIMSGEASEAQIGALNTGLRLTGEPPEAKKADFVGGDPDALYPLKLSPKLFAPI